MKESTPVKRFNDCGYRYRIEIGVGLRRVTQENEFGRDKGADTMELLDELQQADVVLKLGAMTGSSSHFTRVDPLRRLVHKFQCELLVVASRLPHADGENGSGIEAMEMLLTVVAEVAATLVSSPNRFCSYPMVDLLRACARGSGGAKLERRMATVGGRNDARKASGAKRLVDAVPKERARQFGDAYAHAGAMDAMLQAGAQALRNMQKNFEPPSASALRRVNVALNMQALPILFDGARLRTGVQSTLWLGGPGAFGSEYLLPRLLAEGDARTECIRARRAAAWLIAAGKMGAAAYGREPLECFEALERGIRYDLYECRRVSEQHCFVPPKAMRQVILRVARFAERVHDVCQDKGEALGLRLALAVPCLRIAATLPGVSDDGGLVSVWDAAVLLARARYSSKLPVVPTAVLLAGVLGGLVFSLMCPTGGGPFVASAETLLAVEQVEREWPSYPLFMPSADEDRKAEARQRSELLRAGREVRGKLVSANASVCQTIENRSIKRARPRSDASEARYTGALSMLSTTTAFAREMERAGLEAECKPTDGMSPLKRLYVAMLTAEPFVTSYLRQNPRAQNPLFEEGTDSVEATWRELSGGAILLHGMHSVTGLAFLETLEHDWAPRETVKQLLAARKGAEQHKKMPGTGIMRPEEAMKLLVDRGRKVAMQVFGHEDLDDPETKRVLSQQKWLAEGALKHAVYAPLWECMITHFISNAESRKRSR